ncbi:hypothetical protein B0H11DRAFT_2095796 [Mycena galericulata]|nr:hypothetical protein B0H11DRAFT_2095796 [Mycena galericulata]
MSEIHKRILDLPTMAHSKNAAMKTTHAAPAHTTWLKKLALRGAAAVLLFCVASHHHHKKNSLPCQESSRHGRKIGSVEWAPASECAPGTECGAVILHRNRPLQSNEISEERDRIHESRCARTCIHLQMAIYPGVGGPGGSGTSLARQEFSDLIGEDWDILGFDPRGINKTSPQVQCFGSTSDYNVFVANTVLQQGFTLASSTNLSDPAIEAQLVQQSRERTSAQKNMGDELRYMGTATVVRDMDFIAKIFDGEDAKINYWGGSLPERAGFVMIDGVVDPVNWSTEPSHKWPINWLASTEKTYRFYLKTCSRAGPDACPLSEYLDDPYEDIEARLEFFFDRLAVAPLPVPFAFRPGFLTSGAARALLIIYLQQPTQWAESGLAFAQALAGNGTLLFNKLGKVMPRLTPHYDLVRLGVTCLDSPPPASPAEVPTPENLAAEILKTMREVSPHFGASLSVGEPDGGCQYWPVRGPERFPMLIVSNTVSAFIPPRAPKTARSSHWITPIQSGLRINSPMPDFTRMIIQDGPGHCSPSLPTLCTAKLVRAYFAGTLPENGTMCDTSYDFFPDPKRGDPTLVEPTMDAEEKLLASVRAAEELLRDIRG